MYVLSRHLSSQVLFRKFHSTRNVFFSRPLVSCTTSLTECRVPLTLEKKNNNILHHKTTQTFPTTIRASAETRTFSTDTDEDSSTRTLPEILLDEIKEEEEDSQSTQIPDDLAQLMKEDIEPHWRVSSSNSSAVVTLYKKEKLSNGSKVVISFHCQDTLPPSEEEMDAPLLDAMSNINTDDKSSEDDDEMEEEEASPVRFQVRVTKAGKTMLFKCLSEHSEAVIESLCLVDELLDDSLSSDDNKNLSELFQGPEFTELAEELQDALHHYLEVDCGVDENVAAFISMYTDYKEQTEYVAWLKGVHTMIK